MEPTRLCSMVLPSPFQRTPSPMRASQSVISLASSRISWAGMTFPARCLQIVTVAKAFIAYGYPGLPRERLGGSTPPIAIDLPGSGQPTARRPRVYPNLFCTYHALQWWYLHPFLYGCWGQYHLWRYVR